MSSNSRISEPDGDVLGEMGLTGCCNQVRLVSLHRSLGEGRVISEVACDHIRNWGQVNLPPATEVVPKHRAKWWMLVVVGTMEDEEQERA